MGQIAVLASGVESERAHPLVDREQLEALMAQEVAAVARPECGLFGPGSAMWRVDRESILFLGGGRAALLQLAHPFVAHAVDQHSKTRSDPLGRFQRTFTNVYAMVFGDLDSALRSARRVHAIHQRIVGTINEDVGAFSQGSPYAANDVHALLWVHATLIDSALLFYEQVFGVLPKTQREAYYQGSKRFARLFGIPDPILPATLADFEAYMRRMLDSDVISVGEPAREIASFLFSPPSAALGPPLRFLKLMTAGSLTPRLRQEFGFRWSGARERAYHGSLALLGPVYRSLPLRLRVVPAYSHALRRVAGGKGPDPFARRVESLLRAGLARVGMPKPGLG